MKKFFTSLLLLLVVGVSSTWADDLTENTIVNCDFSGGETLFTEASRLTVQNSSTNQNLEFVTASNAANGWAGAKYNFSSLLDKGAKKVYVTFYCYIGDVTSGQFAVGDASKRTYAGSGAWGATTTGAIFTIGINRSKLDGKNNSNNIRVNGVDLGLDYNTYLTTWMQVELTVDLENKTQSYTVKSGETTVASATDVAYVDANATACDIIDLFTGTGNVTYYMDNLLIKDYYNASTTYYTATFTEGNSLTPSVKIYSDEDKTTEVLNGSLENGKTYYYTATNEAYEDYNGSFIVDGADPSVEYTMTAKPTYTVTVNAVDASDNIIKALATFENVYDGKSISYYYPKYLTDDNGNITYSCDNFGKETVSASSSSTSISVEYAAYEGTAVYAEAEDKFTAAAVSNDNCSMGAAERGFTSSKDVLTINEAGVYDITYAVCSNNVNYDTYVYVYSNGLQIEEYNAKISTNYIKTTGTRTISNVALSAGDVISFKGGSTNLILDYAYAVKTAELSSVTYDKKVGSTGFGTFSATVPVTVPEGVVVYTSTYDEENTVTATPDETITVIPANTGVIFKGTPNYNGIYQFAATTDEASSVATALTAAPAGVTGDASTIFGLLKDSNVFALVNSGVTLAANSAYLKIAAESAKAVNFVVAGEATAISSVKDATASQNAYNLAGQRVNSKAKGIVVAGGKKYMNK